MKDEPPLRHKSHVQPSPTVIHHYEDDETLLARWLRRGYEKGAKFWFLVGGVAVVIAVLMVLVSGLSAGRSVTHQAWAELMMAKGADDQVRIAEAQAATPAAPWALLQAAEGRYDEGVRELPGNREAAGPLLNRAYELFEQAYREADPKAELGDALKRLAALGMGRALEARNELERAKDQYRSVAKQWPDTPEGRQAARLAERLERPENVEFYKKLYAFKPKEVTVPPGGTSTLDLPFGHPPLDGPILPTGPLPSSGVPIPPLPPMSPPTTPAAPPKTGGGEFPGQVFENNPPPAPAPATNPPAEAPKTTPPK
jgi:tetratricopeptide (TPR) repeat protein